MNDGFQVLFLGCSDLLNALTTIASKVDDGCCLMAIHLSHPSILTFARNVVILKVVSAPLFNVDNANDLSYLWDLWYNVAWPQTTLEIDLSKMLKVLLKKVYQNNIPWILFSLVD